MEELAKKQISSFRIAYAKQVKEGSELTILRSDAGNVSTLEAFANGELCTQFQIVFSERPQ